MLSIDPIDHKPGHAYVSHESVHVTVNKVGPFSNPHETYRYYSLPFCSAAPSTFDGQDGSEDGVIVGGKKHRQGLGGNLAGDRKETSPYDITFGDQVPWRQLCQTTLTPEDVAAFKEAVHNDYYFEFYVEDLPMWGYVGEISGEDLVLGEIEGSRTYLFPHLHFKLGVNGENIVSASIYTQSHRKVDITDPTGSIDVTFSYSVEWINEANLSYGNRMSRYVDSAFLPDSLEIHWLSIINSFVLVLLLTTFLSVILIRILKKDFSKYMDLDEEIGGEEEETGWKLIHGDVFRFPHHKMIFSAAQGSGAQLACACFILLVSALVGIQMGGTQWVNNIILTSLLFPAPLTGIFAWVNSVAIAHKSTAALPFGTILIVLSLFVFVSFPLTIVGGILGRNLAKDFNAPTRTKKLPREIPSQGPWYNSALVQTLFAGFLPFSAIYIELHYIFASVWGHKIYTLFGILFLALAMLTVVTSFITISLIYFQLAREDHRWWWRSFFNGGSTGIFIYAYSFFYYHQKSAMGGLLQGSFFFGYMAIVSFASSLILGYIGWAGTCVFVKYIYGRVKCD
ncbi:hypothetical protein TrRE_jg1584 [Triparma retinervis]|uniref:Transmembrane 9 superfamily member n=1 Tax=Triparma retinervis TaxID=2557542 RepID=A0A9W6ZI78_9STRA|nr:hypothetical protein TrRE_jg1584 [Triparma retinervis]